MSNLAVGIAISSSMNSGFRLNGLGDISGMPVSIAWILLISLVFSIAMVIIQAYRGKLDMLDNHWSIWILGPFFGVCIWSLLICVAGLFGFLVSLII